MSKCIVMKPLKEGGFGDMACNCHQSYIEANRYMVLGVLTETTTLGLRPPDRMSFSEGTVILIDIQDPSRPMCYQTNGDWHVCDA